MSEFFNREHEPFEAANISQLAERVVYRVNGCDNMTVLLVLRATFADFARLSCCFTTIRDVELEAGEREYPVAQMIPGMFVDSVSGVMLRGRRLETPRHYIVSTGRVPVVVLAPELVPDSVDANNPISISIRAVERPKMNSEIAPAWFIQKYGDAIVSGALAKLFAMSNRPWSDPVQAQIELVAWQNALSSARIDSFREDASQNGSGHLHQTIDSSGVL